MANALMMMNKEEKKYFDTRGDHEPTGYGETFTESSEPNDEPESRSEATSSGTDGSFSEGDGGQETTGYADDSGESEQYQPEHSGKQSKRDFSKAYGIAESKRQELKAQLEQQAYQNQMLQQQIQMLMQQNKGEPVAPKQPVMDIPDPNEDPLGYQSYRLESLNKTVLAQQQYLEQQARAYQEQQAMSSLDNAYRASAMEFQKEAPDFAEAYKFLEQSRIAEYMALGYNNQEAAQLLQQDERALAAKSFKERANPAARIYAAAKARGFNTTAAESRLEKVSNGMQKGKSLPRAGGKNIEKAYDISRINEMSDTEFDKFFNQVKAESKKNGDYRKDFY